MDREDWLPPWRPEPKLSTGHDRTAALGLVLVLIHSPSEMPISLVRAYVSELQDCDGQPKNAPRRKLCGAVCS